jgi:hypothetical protein
MQNARNDDDFSGFAIEDRVTAVLHASQPWADFIARPAGCGIVGEPLATVLQVREIVNYLLFAPSAKSVIGNVK